MRVIYPYYSFEIRLKQREWLYCTRACCHVRVMHLSVYLVFNYLLLFLNVSATESKKESTLSRNPGETDC